MVMVTSVDALRDRRWGSVAAAQPGLERLIASAIPLVLASQGGAPDVVALQDQLGIVHPFICEGGTEVHIPTGYFADPRVPRPATNGWEVVDIGRGRSYAHGLRLLVSLYRCRNRHLIVVGAGADWHDRTLLRHVDVPIVVRDPERPQTRLLKRIPGAFVTQACGPAGWGEAILGRTDA